LFTAGNVYLGFFALIETFRGAILTSEPATSAAAPQHFAYACIAIGVAVFLDGLDGRIARMTNTVSDFGREMDSLADLVTFGIAPAVMAFVWGVQFTGEPPAPFTLEHIQRLGYFITFLYLLFGAMRLARFNVQANPVPKNPGRPDRKYFVGMPIPSAAGIVAAVIYAANSSPLHWWGFSVAWLALMGTLACLMVSTWRYPSFKDIDLLKPRSPLMFVATCAMIYLIWTWSQAVLLIMAVSYMLCGILIRIGGIVRRRFRHGSNSAPTTSDYKPHEHKTEH
jgi:CDP-diacylglycerol--serine O-phosphatidyltransferase